MMFLGALKNDPRLPLIWKLLGSVLSQKDIESSYGLVRLNTLFVVCRKTVVLEIELDTVPGFDITIDFANSQQFKDVSDQYYEINENDFILVDLESKWREFHYINNTILYQQLDVASDPSFAEFLTLKADDGLKFYKVKLNEQIILIPIFLGFPKLSKGETFDLFIYNDSLGPFFIIEFIVHKKKIGRTVKMIFKTLNMSTNHL